jgi:hypothetical protein
MEYNNLLHEYPIYKPNYSTVNIMQHKHGEM